MKTKLDFYHMTPFYELNYFIAVYVEHGNVEILRKELGIDSNSVVERILGCCGQFREAHNN